MELYLFEPAKFQQLYNCSIYSVDAIPLAQRQKPVLGTVSIALFVVFEMLYIPCLLAMWRHLEQSCYKIMFAIGIVDILALLVCGLLTGVFGIQGAVFCSAPTLQYLAGSFGIFAYYFETIAAALLAANRCLEMIAPVFAEALFHGHRTWLAIGFVFIYGLCAWLFVPSAVFNSISYSWYFNPHDRYIEGVDDLYGSQFDTIHQFVAVSLMPLFYGIFLLAILMKQKGAPNIPGSQIALKKIIFFQVFLLSALNETIAGCYLTMSFVPISPELSILFGTYMWQLVHGLPPVIYLAVNKTLRRDCARLFKHLRIHNFENNQNSQHSTPTFMVAGVVKTVTANRSTQIVGY